MAFQEFIKQLCHALKICSILIVTNLKLKEFLTLQNKLKKGSLCSMSFYERKEESDLIQDFESCILSL